GSAAGRALGARRFQEAYFVAVASDSNWQFGLARKTSRRDWHAVRLSKVPGVPALALEWPSAARTVARLARRGQVLPAQRGEATGRKSLPRRRSWRAFSVKLTTPPPQIAWNRRERLPRLSGKVALSLCDTASRFDDLGGYCAKGGTLPGVRHRSRARGCSPSLFLLASNCSQLTGRKS